MRTIFWKGQDPRESTCSYISNIENYSNFILASEVMLLRAEALDRLSDNAISISQYEILLISVNELKGFPEENYEDETPCLNPFFVKETSKIVELSIREILAWELSKKRIAVPVKEIKTGSTRIHVG